MAIKIEEVKCHLAAFYAVGWLVSSSKLLEACDNTQDDMKTFLKAAHIIAT